MRPVTFVPSGAKDDLPDAVVLLRILAQNREQLRALRLDTAATRELAALNEVRRGAVDRRTQLSCELRSTLKTMFPQALELCGDDLWTPLALDFLERWPELALLQRAKPASVRAFYTEHNSRRPAVIAQRLERIAAARALTTDRAVLDPAVMQISVSFHISEPLEHLKWDRDLAGQTAAFRDTDKPSMLLLFHYNVAPSAQLIDQCGYPAHILCLTFSDEPWRCAAPTLALAAGSALSCFRDIVRP